MNRFKDVTSFAPNKRCFRGKTWNTHFNLLKELGLPSSRQRSALNLAQSARTSEKVEGLPRNSAYHRLNPVI